VICKGVFLFCDNEHGFGDVTFPSLNDMDTYAIVQEIGRERTIGQLRKEAKQAGWGRVNGGDYCPACMESGV